METIKSIATTYFEVKLVQSKSGLYYIVYATADDNEPTTTEAFKDYHMASFAFDDILVKLEGH